MGSIPTIYHSRRQTLNPFGHQVWWVVEMMVELTVIDGGDCTIIYAAHIFNNEHVY